MAPLTGEAHHTRIDKYVERVLLIALPLATVVAVLKAFTTNETWMNLVQDDFFYYLKVAENVAAGRGSTFNDIVPTNGYHPLWMWLLAITVRFGGDRAVPFFLGVSIVLATMLTFVFGRLLLVKSGVERLLATSLAVYASAYAMHVFCYGMEVSLVVPLMLGLMVFLQRVFSPKRMMSLSEGLGIGFLVSLMVLARLDSMIFAGLIAMFFVVQPALRQRITSPFLLGLVGGVAPLIAYFLYNRFTFGVWMPISGAAKQLKLDHGFTKAAWISLFSPMPAQVFTISLIVIALLAFAKFGKRLQSSERAIIAAALLFPLVYTAALSWLSDWLLWGWYFYTLRVALLASFMLLLRSNRLKSFLAKPLLTGLVALAAIVSLKTVRVPPQQPEIVRVAREIQRFAASHPGRYAMGDRSGAVGYLLQDPVVQTEGLMMDRSFLNLLARQVPLEEVLKTYRVQYYVGSELQPYPGCLHAAEPVQAGVHAPHSVGVFCAPLAEWTADGVKTMIFRVGND